MPNYRASQSFEAGFKRGAISLTLGIINMILILACLAWTVTLVAVSPVAIVGLIFGAIGLNSRGKYLAVTGIVLCSYALFVSLLICTLRWI